MSLSHSIVFLEQSKKDVEQKEYVLEPLPPPPTLGMLYGINFIRSIVA